MPVTGDTMKLFFRSYCLILFLSVLIIFSGTACQKKLQVKNTETDSITSVPADDPEMNKIIGNARKTIDAFFAAMEDGTDENSGFQVKYPFDTDAGSPESVEHIWLSDLTRKDGKYFGIVANDPFYLAALKFGDEVEYDPGKISDWMYFHGDKIIGGESVRYLIESIPEKERSADEKAILELFK
jgi:uncharacterized protein YegJ (DUF2314 family)